MSSRMAASVDDSACASPAEPSSAGRVSGSSAPGSGRAARSTFPFRVSGSRSSVTIDVGAMPDAGTLSGYVWHDADHDNVSGGIERRLEGWTVNLLQDGQTLRSLETDAEGYYLFRNVVPSYGTDDLYSIEFLAPGAGPQTALMGETDSDFDDGMQRIEAIDVQQINDWLDDNSFARDPAADPIIAEYIAEGNKFVAMRLAKGDSSAVHPIALRIETNEPCIPLRLTSIAAFSCSSFM